MLQLSSTPPGVTLIADEVGLDDHGTRGTATVHMKEVTAILIDGISTSRVRMECDDGEILTLSHTDDHAELLVEWNDFAAGTHVVVHYRFEFGSIEITTELAQDKR